MAKYAKACSNKNNMMNGDASLHTGRKRFASGAWACCTGYDKVQRSPETLARGSGIRSMLTACSMGSSGTAPPLPDSQPCFLRVAAVGHGCFILQGCCKLLLSINYPVIRGDCRPPFDAPASPTYIFISGTVLSSLHHSPFSLLFL